MSKIALTPNASGTGTFTIASPGTNTDRTLTLPDATGTVVYADANGNVGIGTTSPDNVPSYKGLTLSGTSGGFVFAKSTTGSITAEMSADDGVTASKFGSRTNHPVLLISNGIERVRIDTAGRVTMPYQPAFSAKHTATEGPAINAPIIQWGVQVNVGGGAFSNGRYTAPISGKYLISLSLLQNTGTGSGGVYLTQNGATVYRIMYAVTGFGYQMASGTYILSLAANDYIEFINEVGGVQWYGDATGLGAMTVQLIG